MCTLPPPPPPPPPLAPTKLGRRIIRVAPSSWSSRSTLRARQLSTRFPKTMLAATCAHTLPSTQRAQLTRTAGTPRVQVCSRRRRAGASTPLAPPHLRPRASIQFRPPATSCLHLLICRPRPVYMDAFCTRSDHQGSRCAQALCPLVQPPRGSWCQQQSSVQGAARSGAMPQALRLAGKRTSQTRLKCWPRCARQSTTLTKRRQSLALW